MRRRIAVLLILALAGAGCGPLTPGKAAVQACAHDRGVRFINVQQAYVICLDGKVHHLPGY